MDFMMTKEVSRLHYLSHTQAGSRTVQAPAVPLLR